MIFIELGAARTDDGAMIVLAIDTKPIGVREGASILEEFE